jgi:hypothetical protein
MRNCIRTLFCVDGICFDNMSDASKFLMTMASRGKKVTITRQIDTSNCRPS